MTKKFVLYAPNVHVGGGKVLLDSLLESWPETLELDAFLDVRAKNELELPGGTRVRWVSASLASRLYAELSLFKCASSEDFILCFHGLPPMLPVAGTVLVFQQNRNYLGLNPLSQFPLKVGLRLAFERLVSTVFKNRVAKYIVQTPSMKESLSNWYSGSKKSSSVEIQVFPFMAQAAEKLKNESREKRWDFVYVADGVAHKNHLQLFEAWKLLAKDGLFPSLALTLGPRDGFLIEQVKLLRQEHDLNVTNLGQLSRGEVTELYEASKALIFPSTSESFGLPLIEAREHGLSIVASELDFVRDVCCPSHTFDPGSPTSMCRAVKRYMGKDTPPVKLHSPKEFWDEFVS